MSSQTEFQVIRMKKAARKEATQSKQWSGGTLDIMFRNSTIRNEMTVFSD